MTVEELMCLLKEMPKDYEVFYEGGDFKDDWREVKTVEVAHRATEVSWNHRGVFLE